MQLTDHYKQLRGEVAKGKTPQARLGFFMSGLSGLIEQHADNVEDVKSIGAEFRNNQETWNQVILTSA